MKISKNIIVFILAAVFLAACSPSTNTTAPANVTQSPAQSQDNNSSAVPSSGNINGDSSTSAEPQAPAGPIDQSVIDELNSNNLGFNNLKIGDAMDKVTEMYGQLRNEWMYQNDYCSLIGNHYILYNYDDASRKKITGAIYMQGEKFCGITLNSSTTDDVLQIFKNPTSITKGKWTPIQDETYDNPEDFVEYYYEIGHYALYFDFYGAELIRVVYRINDPSTANSPEITKRFQASSLKELLKEQRQVSVYKSPSSNDMVYTAINSDGFDAVYLWREKYEKPIQVQSASANDNNVSFVGTNVIWSPDAKHFILDCGTSPARINYLVSVADGKIDTTFDSYIIDPLWVKNSSEIIFASKSKVRLKADVGDDNESNNISVYDLNTKQTTILEKGTADYFFTDVKLIGDALTITKEYPESGKKETVNITVK